MGVVRAPAACVEGASSVAVAASDPLRDRTCSVAALGASQIELGVCDDTGSGLDGVRPATNISGWGCARNCWQSARSLWRHSGTAHLMRIRVHLDDTPTAVVETFQATSRLRIKLKRCCRRPRYQRFPSISVALTGASPLSEYSRWNWPDRQCRAK